MSSLTRNTIALVLLVSYCVALPSISYSQTKASKKTATATVSGRVTVAGKGREGIVVSLGTHNFAPAQIPPRTATTDAEGNYRISDVPPGNHYVAPLSVLLVPEVPNPVNQTGKPLLVSEGESVEGIDFALMRGCVITGKVTDPDGRPLVEQRVSAIAVEQPNRFYMNQSPFQTDDRGVYRIFGLRAGRYKVAAGQTGDGGPAPDRTGYQTVYYPNFPSADQAKIIELAEGEQATNIDMTMTRVQPGVAVAGIIVNGETNKPVTNGRVALQKMNDDRGSFLQAGTMLNQKGEFRLENVPPGKYSVHLMAQGESELRADALEFQVSDQDVAGLIVRTTRGASISGTVHVEGTNDPAVIARLRQLRIYAWVQGGSGGGARPSLVSADGSFGIGPLPAGIVNFEFAGIDHSQENGLIPSRVERDGVVVPRGGFDIKAGEQVSGVRIVLTHGSGTVRGTVTFENGPPPPAMRFLVRLSKPGENELRLPSREVDARGRFMIAGVSPGAYDLHVNAINWGSRERAPFVTQLITVAEGGITEVVVSIDLGRNP
ncbi:MAG: carboxypeptidase regulatory-like domain-containing protein [Pyrinomonadaceae bacterium]